MKVLLDRDEVYKVVEKVTNEAIEKHYHKSTIQKQIIYELSTLQPVFADFLECQSNCNFKKKKVKEHDRTQR